MVRHTREHPRLKEEHPDGLRKKLSAGTLFVPAALAEKKQAPLLLFMHGGEWLPEVAGAKKEMAVITIQRSDGYRPLFEKDGAFIKLLTEASEMAGLRWYQRHSRWMERRVPGHPSDHALAH